MDKVKPYGICVKGILTDDQSRLLLLKRVDDCKNYQGQWDLPGGKMNPGETVEMTVVRETLEETGLQVVVDGLVGAIEWEMEKARVICLLMGVTVVGGTLTLSEEHQDFSWVAPNELADLDLLTPLNEHPDVQGLLTGDSQK